MMMRGLLSQRAQDFIIEEHTGGILKLEIPFWGLYGKDSGISMVYIEFSQVLGNYCSSL